MMLENTSRNAVFLQAGLMGLHNEDANYPKKRCMMFLVCLGRGFPSLLSLFICVSSSLEG
jgi:hypothetical protein